MNSFHRRTARATSAPPAKQQAIERHGLLRLDALLVSQALAPSRTAAQRLISAGKVFLDGKLLSKAALELPPDSRLTVNDADETRYVSRGGLKLASALSATGIDATGKTCLDVGQSTGGFSDCLLQAGARHVVGVDVGHGQLHGKLKNDPRISALEGINCRHLSAADLGEHLPRQGFDLIVGDVSFISMRLILPQLPALLNDAGDLLLLIKPQFEVGPDGIGKGGIVRNSGLYPQVERTFIDLARILQLTVKAWLDSSITGGDGNREFFIWLKK